VPRVANTTSATPSPVAEVPVPVLQSRRLAKRFGAEGRIDDRTFVLQGDGNRPPGVDFESLKPDAINAEVRAFWITDAELEAKPNLIKTMSVKPPMGTGRVRLIEIVGYDLQPCGGTHVHTTKEIGDVRVTQIEKKGKQNRRVRIAFA